MGEQGMRYPEYEDLLAESRPETSRGSIDPDFVFGEPDLEALLMESERQEQNRIETELDQVETLLQHRTEIHEQTIDQLEIGLQDEQTRLNRLQRPSIPMDRILSQKRRVRELEQQLHEQRQLHWSDREQLERERRRLHRELAELEDTDLSVFFR
ncbi:MULTISPECIES: hypothetical protein [Halorussus]|uniref:hypothetical protein n=1 Tax=Halorussus TaxID=1070314 RepID=UPI0020A0FB3F|nr:hypothetical protein [Halorussus vallis]USZ77568.1 hypothetical protein NGM07_09580 [Halorussus vallis]